ncbi:MAG: hypothetical protein COA78_17695 [Blastopirellula sp.]|nr:MAG: hypothetical protein COA78_17695 [Blastopirellula sp.]
MKWLPKFRFSMRTLFILVTLLCVLLVPVSVKLYQARQQRLVVEWVLASGGSVDYDYERPKDGGYRNYAEPEDNLWLRSILGNDFFDTVVYVSIENPTVTDISVLSHLQSLDSLVITFSSKESYTAKHMAELSKLNCPLTVRLIGPFLDLTPIQRLNNIRVLTIGATYVKDLTPLIHLDQLESLYILNNYNLQDYSALPNVRNLKSLGLSSNQVTDISALSKLSSLKSLKLHYTRVTDFTPLSDLTQLEKLEIIQVIDRDFSPISDPRQLKELEIIRDKVTDLAPFAKLINLRDLELEIPNANDLTPLAKLVNLRDLELETPKINNLSPLFKLSNLETLILKDMQVPEAEIDKLKKALPNCSVRKR